jgi:hypothetical protein
MVTFDAYRDAFRNARLRRKPNGVLEVALHTDGGKLVFNGHTHEEFVDLFHVIGEDRANRVVILTGSGDAFMDTISPEGFDFFSPQRYDKILREGRKVLSNILDVEVPMVSRSTHSLRGATSAPRCRPVCGALPRRAEPPRTRQSIDRAAK